MLVSSMNNMSRKVEYITKKMNMNEQSCHAPHSPHPPSGLVEQREFYLNKYSCLEDCLWFVFFVA